MASTARPAPAGLLTRVVGGLRQAWFGPSQPLAPEAPPDTAGRQFDYPVGFNLRLQPRQDEGTSFADLRGLADAYHLASRHRWKCKGCSHQYSVTSGTIFASRKLPVRDILLAIAVFVNGAKGHSALARPRRSAKLVPSSWRGWSRRL